MISIPTDGISPRKYDSAIMSRVPLAYWRMAECSGTVALDRMAGQRHGAYSNVTLCQSGPDNERRAAMFNGSTSYLNIFSASLAASMSGSEGTLVFWGRMASAGTWSDGAGRILVYLAAGANFIRVIKRTGSNQLGFDYRAGGVTDSVTDTAIATANWFFCGITWSASNDRVRIFTNYRDNANDFLAGQASSLGTWSGAFDTAVLGAGSTVPANVHAGYMGHAAIWARELKEATLIRMYQRMVGG